MTFQVNKPDKVSTRDLYKAMTSRSFLSSFVKAFQQTTGRTLDVGFSLSPQLIEEGTNTDKLEFKPVVLDPPTDSNAAVIFKDSSISITGLPGWAMWLIVGLLVLALVVFFIAVFVMPMYKAHVKKMTYKDYNEKTKRHKIHPSVIAAIKAQQETGNAQDQNEEEDENDVHAFEVSDSESESDHDEVNSEILPDTLPDVRELDPYAADRQIEDSIGQPTGIWLGATNLTSNTEKPNGRWTQARARLKVLENQLDELLERLPKTDDQKTSLASAASNALVEMSTTRERARYARPTIPDLSGPLGLTPESQPIRRVRRGTSNTNEDMQSRHVVNTVRRAPKLTAFGDDIKSPSVQDSTSTKMPGEPLS